MSISAMLPVIKHVLLNPTVIATAVILLLYVNFVSFVVKYQKKPSQPKKRRRAPPPVAPASENADESSASETPASENE